MTLFSFRAVDGKGVVVEDSVDAPTREAACTTLEGRGLVPLAVEPASAAEVEPPQRFLGTGAPFRLRDLAVFSRQFGTLLRSGLSITHGLDTLGRQGSEQHKPILLGIHQAVSHGCALSKALSQFPSSFNPLYVATVSAAERVGARPAAFVQLADMLVWELRIRRSIRAALQYPATVAAIMVLAVVVLQQLVVPQFLALFRSMGGELPLPTRILIGSSEFVSGWWWLLIAGAATAAYGLRRAVATPLGRAWFDRALLGVPVVGPLLHQTYLARFARMFSLLQSNGLPILTSLAVLGETVGNSEVARQLQQVHDDVHRGESLADAVARRSVFSPMVKNMIRVGEESGMIADSMKTVCEFYDDEIQSAIETLTRWIEPALTVILGAFVLFLALAIFLPWWDLASLYRS